MPKLVLPLLVIGGLTVLLSAISSLGLEGPVADTIQPILRVVLWLSGALLAGRLATVLIEQSFARRSGRQPPKLLSDLIAGLIWIAMLTALSVVEFGVSPSAALATSGVLIAVVGFAVRSLLADLFYGLTMAIERPFEIGDWIQLAEGDVGRVVEMTWRAVKLVSPSNNKIVVPNAKLATEQIVNFDQPEPYWRKSFNLILSYEVPPRQVKQILETAVREVPASAGVPRTPETRIVGYHEQGVEWELRYWLPNFDTASETGHRIHEALLQSMQFAGIRVPRPREEIFMAELVSERASDKSGSEQWIHRVELFAPVEIAERTALQKNARRLDLKPGDEVVIQDEEGSSLFVIQQGSFDVLIREQDGSFVHTGNMGPGSIFGELSLLTGSRRSATVRAATHGIVFEITKDQLEPLITSQPDLARQFAGVLADRRLSDSLRNGSKDEGTLEDARRGIVTNILNGAKSFFRIAA